MASVSSPRPSPTSSMIAFAPSKSRSRWRSRNAGWPLRTRSPSQTPSPRTKPESNTDTTAWSRGTSSPLTQMRMRSLRRSSAKSCVPCATLGARLGPLRLVHLLGRLVVGQRLRGVHVSERGVPGDEVLGRLDAEALGEHRAERLDLHLAEARQRREVGAQLVAVGRLRPDARGVAAPAVTDVLGECLDLLGHRARIAMDRRLGAEHRL